MDVKHSKPMVFLPENKPYLDKCELSVSYSKITWTQEGYEVTVDDDCK